MRIIKHIKNGQLQASTTIPATETQLGGVIDVSQYAFLTLWVDYTIGDETSFDVIVKYVDPTGSGEYPEGYWSVGSVGSYTEKVYRFTATKKYPVTLDVTEFTQVKVYGDSTGGTPTGTVAINYTLSY